MGFYPISTPRRSLLTDLPESWNENQKWNENQIRSTATNNNDGCPLRLSACCSRSLATSQATQLPSWLWFFLCGLDSTWRTAGVPVEWLSPGVLSEMQNPGPHLVLVIQKLHFNEPSEWFLGTVRFERLALCFSPSMDGMQLGSPLLSFLSQLSVALIYF